MKTKPTYEELERRVQKLETDCSQLGKKLHQTKLFSEEIMTYMTEGLVLTDSQENVVFINQRLSEMLGYAPEQIIGKCWLDMVSAEQQAIARQLLAKRAQGHADRYDINLHHRDGHKFPVLIGAGPRFDKQNGKFIGTIGVVNDITERKLTEEALRDSQTRYKALHNASFGGIAIHYQGIILECNQGLSEITGYEYTELIGMNGLLLIAERSRESVMNNIQNKYEKPYEASGLRKNGEEFPMRLEARNVIYKGKYVRTVEIRDITDRKKAEEALRNEKKKLQTQLNQVQKTESVDRLAGGVAHNFNNMLSVILGHTEMALEETDPTSPLYADLHSVYQVAERLAALTRQLLAFASKQTVAPKIVDINDIVERTLSMLRQLIGEDIDLLWVPEASLQPVKIDPKQIDQILANLCVNARDAIDGQGKITIETSAKTLDEAYSTVHLGSLPGEYVLLEVSDDGCGMNTKTLNQIFEPFFTTKEQGKGTGLGLASVYGMVKQNNGFINVYSEQGHGTTFKIYLPVYAAKSDESVEKAPDDLPVEHGKETILLVEDETAILEMTTRMLERLGYTVVAAATPGEAICLAHEYQGRIDLLMTDVVMPEMNGRELAGNLLSHYPDLKLLFMSGYTANVIAHHGVLEESVHFIQKPFSKIELGGKVREALEG